MIPEGFSQVLCVQCGKPCKAGRIRFCSKKCTFDNRTSERAVGRKYGPELTRGTIGAISELRAATNLMEMGFHVFRSLSPQSPCDLIAMKDGKMIRVEVRTGSEYKFTGNVSFAGIIDPAKHDILAIVLPDRIIYQPEILI